MKKIIFCALVLVFLTACAQHVPVPRLCRKVSLRTTYYGKPPRHFAHYVQVTEEILNSIEFQELLLQQDLMGTKDSPSDVLNTLLNGAEGQSIRDCTWNLVYSFESRVPAEGEAKVLAWSLPQYPVVSINTYKFSERTPAEVVGTICHEQAHKLGYEHDSEATPARQYSVPYVVQKLCEEHYGPHMRLKTSKRRKYAPMMPVPRLIR